MLNIKYNRILVVFSICLNSLLIQGQGFDKPVPVENIELKVSSIKNNEERQTESIETKNLSYVIQTSENSDIYTLKTEEVIYKSKSDNKFDRTQFNRETSRINVGNGTVWTSTDVIKVEPEINVELLTEPVVKNNEFVSEKLDFRIKLNYSDYITKYELKIYRGEDRNTLDPLEVISGQQLKNEEIISWIPESMKYLVPGNQLTYKLKVYDKNGNFDETNLGVINIISEKSKNNTDDFWDGYKDKTYSSANLRIRNIKNIFGKVNIYGNNLTGIKVLKINGDSYSINSETDAVRIERLIPTGEHSLLVQTVDDSGKIEDYQLNIEIDKTYFFGVGVADFTIGQYSNNDEYKDIDGNEMNGRFFKQGRLAFDGEAKFNEDTRGRIQFDTKDNDVKDLFNNFFRIDKRDVLFRIREDNFYPTYGDDSIITSPNDYLQQGKLFGELEYKKSKILWGTYGTGLSGTEFSQMNRTLYGAKAEIISPSTNDFGEDRYNLTVFGSDAETIHAKNEFIGTGGSLYFLKNGEVIRDTEKVSIEVRSRDSGITEKVVNLIEGKDYAIDNYQGRIILGKPLRDHVSDSYNDLIQQDGRYNNELYLVVEYDYEPKGTESLNNMIYGGRGSVWLGDHLKVGGTYITEEKENSSNYKVYGGDMVLRYSDGTYLQGEYSKSESRNIDNYFISYDGGLEFEKKRTNSLEMEKGRAYSLRGVLNLYDLNKKLFKPYGNEINAWYINVGEGFSGGQYTLDHELKAYGGEIKLNPRDGLYIRSKLESIEKNYFLNDVVTKKDSAMLQLAYAVNDKLRLSTGVERITEKETKKEDKEATIMAVRADYKLTSDLDIYSIVQQALQRKNYDNRSLYRLGLEAKIKDRLTLKAEGKLGDNDTSGAEVTADYKITDNYSVYAGYDLWNNNFENTDKIIVGQRSRLTDKFSVYSENQFLKERERKSYLNSYGADYRMTDNYRAGLSFQYGEVEPNDGDSYDRTAVSLSSSLIKPNFQLQNKVEYRVDKGDRVNEVQYVLLNSMGYKLSNSLRLVGKADYTTSKDRNSKRKINEYAEIGIGIAYRPVYNDRLNLLGRYSYILNKENETDREVSYTEETKHIIELEGSYALTKRLTLGMKEAVRFGNDYYKRSDGKNIKVEKNFALLGLRTEYEVIKEWDIMLEYRFLADIGENHKKENLKHGALVGVYRHIGNNLKIGIGYNFSSFQDDLRETTIDARGWFVNIIGKF